MKNCSDMFNLILIEIDYAIYPIYITAYSDIATLSHTAHSPTNKYYLNVTMFDLAAKSGNSYLTIPTK